MTTPGDTPDLFPAGPILYSSPDGESADECRHGCLPAGAKQRLSIAVGKPVDAYVMAVRATDGEILALYPPEQDPRVCAEITTNVAHGFACPGPDCDTCAG